MPIATGYLESVSVDALEAKPTPDFNIGPVRWPVSELAAAPELEPFRVAFQESCAGRRGVEAATCVSSLLARRVRYARPSIEFLHPSYVPAEALDRHLNKSDGAECVNRSALAASLLLSSGVPARVLQLLPPNREGHTIFEVWDEAAGWVAVDPSLGAVLHERSGAAGYAGISEALKRPGEVIFVDVPGAKSPEHKGSIELRYGGTPAYFTEADVRYPEPWLYLRVGKKQAPWPFRASWARAGVQGWFDGPAQAIARWAMVFFALCGVAPIVIRRRRAQPVPMVATPLTTLPNGE